MALHFMPNTNSVNLISGIHANYPSDAAWERSAIPRGTSTELLHGYTSVQWKAEIKVLFP